MPLLRGRILGYDVGRRMFDFTMLTPDAKTIDCSISTAAMDRLVGITGYAPNQREAQFAEVRDEIETIASNIFDREHAREIHIFSKHVEFFSKRKGSPGKP